MKNSNLIFLGYIALASVIFSVIWYILYSTFLAPLFVTFVVIIVYSTLCEFLKKFLGDEAYKVFCSLISMIFFTLLFCVYPLTIVHAVLYLLTIIFLFLTKNL